MTELKMSKPHKTYWGRWFFLSGDLFTGRFTATSAGARGAGVKASDIL